MLCRHCQKPINHEISAKTSYEYRYHVKCRPWPPYNTRAQERKATKQAFFDSKLKEHKET